MAIGTNIYNLIWFASKKETEGTVKCEMQNIGGRYMIFFHCIIL